MPSEPNVREELIKKAIQVLNNLIERNLEQGVPQEETLNHVQNIIDKIIANRQQAGNPQ